MRKLASGGTGVTEDCGTGIIAGMTGVIISTSSKTTVLDNKASGNNDDMVGGRQPVHSDPTAQS